jgi:hypothetical protein
MGLADFLRRSIVCIDRTPFISAESACLAWPIADEHAIGFNLCTSSILLRPRVRRRVSAFPEAVSAPRHPAGTSQDFSLEN